MGWTSILRSRSVQSGVDGKLRDARALLIQRFFALLSIQGRHLGLLFNALASRDIIREPLEQYYGFAQPEREQILKAPFHLRLVPQAQGAYQAGLQLQVSLPHQSQGMQRSLKVLSDVFAIKGFVLPDRHRPAGLIP